MGNIRSVHTKAGEGIPAVLAEGFVATRDLYFIGNPLEKLGRILFLFSAFSGLSCFS